MNGCRPHKALEQPATRGSAHPRRFIVLALFLWMCLGGSGISVAQPIGPYPRLIEVFTTTEVPVVGDFFRTSLSASPEIEIQTYELDRIQQFETQLSNDLPADPNKARKIALQRLQQWDETTRAQLRQTAIGLAKAMQYGIDRFPAIVFDGEVVVYGLIDMDAALERYRVWQKRKGERP